MSDQIYFVGDKKLYEENVKLQGKVRDLESNLAAAWARGDEAEAERDRAYLDRAAADNRVERAAKIVADLHASFQPKLVGLVGEKQKPDYERLAMQGLADEQDEIVTVEAHKPLTWWQRIWEGNHDSTQPR